MLHLKLGVIYITTPARSVHMHAPITSFMDERFGQMSVRKHARTALASISVAAVAAFLAGCSAGEGSATAANADCENVTKIGFSHPVGEAELVKSLKSLLETKSAAEGCVEMLFDSTTANNLETQRDAIETWVTQDIDAIVVSPVDPAALDGLRQQAQAKGIKWISYGLRVDGADGMAGFDSDASGQLVADAAIEWANENHPEGQVTAAVSTLTPLAAAAGGRWTHPIAALDGADIQIVSQQDCADQACGLEITESVLRQHPDLRIFIGFNDDAALGAITAFKNAGIDLGEVFIAGQDGSRAALVAVQEGSMKITAAIDTESLANTIILASTNAIKGEGETSLMAETKAATTEDPELIERLLAQYQATN